jgi:hypothetical protein
MGFWIFIVLIFGSTFDLLAEIVEKRGFVIEGEGGKLFLSSTPNLPSCCVHKQEYLIELEGFPKSSPFSVVTLKGQWTETPKGGRLVAESSLRKEE